MMGQWEFQIFAKGAKDAGDQTWVARYLLERTAEKHGYSINWHCKPIKGDWNGSGMHANFSNTLLRDAGRQGGLRQGLQGVRAAHQGAHRRVRCRQRSASDRAARNAVDRQVQLRRLRPGASIRIPIATVENGWKGWLEDRRPASNADPYKVAGVIIDTVKAASANIKV